MTEAPSDEDLVKAFLAATSRYSLRDAGEQIGVSHETVNRWRKGDRSDLLPGTRRALLDFVWRYADASRGRVSAEEYDVRHMTHFIIRDAGAGGERGPASVPGFTILLPRPREAFEAWYRELKGWATELHLPDDEVDQLATQTIGPLARFGTRYQEGQEVDVRNEEAQMKVIEGMKELIREDLRSRGR